MDFTERFGLESENETEKEAESENETDTDTETKTDTANENGSENKADGVTDGTENGADGTGGGKGGAPMRRALALLLKSFGFETEEGDALLLDWALDMAEGFIKHELNIEYLTLNLAEPMLNTAAGEFLKAKKNSAPEKTALVDLTPAVKRIEVGDTNTEFSVSGLTPEQRFDLLTEYLIKSGKRQLMGYRRIKW